MIENSGSYVGAHRADQQTIQPGQPGLGAFAAAEESLFLHLAKRVNQLGVEPANPEGVGIEPLYVDDLKARLGKALPQLTPEQEEIVVRTFAARYSTLPTDHPRYPVQDHHVHNHHDDEGCGKRHGPMQRFWEAFEHKTIGKIRNPRVKLATALGSRALFLMFCPGDDIAAIGLQTYSAWDGNVDHSEHGHAHQDLWAVLPSRPRAEKEPQELKRLNNGERWRRWVAAQAVGNGALAPWAQRTLKEPQADRKK